MCGHPLRECLLALTVQFEEKGAAHVNDVPDKTIRQQLHEKRWLRAFVSHQFCYHLLCPSSDLLCLVCLHLRQGPSPHDKAGHQSESEHANRGGGKDNGREIQIFTLSPHHSQSCPCHFPSLTRVAGGI